MIPSSACDIALVTILYRSEDGLADFLDSLQAQEMRNWRLYVIDNASPDGSADIAAGRDDPRIVLLRNTANLGFAKAANQGMRAALADGAGFVVLINNDIVFESDFLRRFAAARQTTAAEVITPRVMLRDDPTQSWYAGGSIQEDWVFTNLHHRYDPAASLAPKTVDFAPGCCLGISRAVLEKIGLLDERFFVYWEDVDFCLRLRRHGIPITYVAELSLLHVGAASSGGSAGAGFIRLYYRSYAQILRKHFGWLRAELTILRILALELRNTRGDLQRVARIARAMLGGLLAPGEPEVGLDRAG